MKLIIKEYLASMKERNELDVLIPELLSQMNFIVISKPGIGSRQYGVDIAAFGELDNKDPSVYLFTVKAGNIGRNDWNKQPQDLLPSLQDIIHTYIPTHIPKQYEQYPIKICVCYGGDLDENVRLSFSTYTKENSNERISIIEWGGEKLSDLVNEYFLNERLMPEKTRGLFRKSISLLDEPEASYKYFVSFLNLLVEDIKVTSTLDSQLLALRQIAISLWILYAWGKEADNLESVYLCSEITVLYAWNVLKHQIEKSTKKSELFKGCFQSILKIHYEICTSYLNKLLPYTDKLFSISKGVGSPNRVDVNLKLFDILGRMSLHGIWTFIAYQKSSNSSKEILEKEIFKLYKAIKELIVNNPLLFSPYKDGHCIEIALTLWFLSTATSNHQDIKSWIKSMISRISFNLSTKKNYPTISNNYSELIDNRSTSQEVFQYNTGSSALYPTIALFIKLLGFDDLLEELIQMTKNCIPHCNLQLWHPDELSEDNFYLNKQLHGASITHIDLNDNWEKQVFDECNENDFFSKLSAIKNNYWIIILVACRHYRLPIPPEFIKALLSKQ